jgi:hypothetical protein
MPFINPDWLNDPTISAGAKIDILADERITAIPSVLAPKGPRPKFMHTSDSIRHTPKARTLSEMDGERSD